ncbi:hypothetical protein BRO54_2306 [Geobacillus proteiniphilus]|uniref:Uncharacterized protein n=1 Tax=Geobacillus proteiniphilus TaxID=860353 RepID=A0A1Q5SXB4_9BACL|nr:hypothetical protein BRO54_2306 [Geobacillus proteiniphilus]
MYGNCTSIPPFFPEHRPCGSSPAAVHLLYHNEAAKRMENTLFFAPQAAEVV